MEKLTHMSGSRHFDSVPIETTSACDEALPQRPVPERLLVPIVRRMDDPEILERVLSGLLDL
jgi:hypothetical protein